MSSGDSRLWNLRLLICQARAWRRSKAHANVKPKQSRRTLFIDLLWVYREISLKKQADSHDGFHK